MREEPVERQLAAILAADIVGYSRLMEANEERTLRALRQHRREFFDPTVARHGGRIFKAMGDGFLVEFGSVLNAARRAVEIQLGMLERNSGVPEDRHIKFRIGINLGDIIVEGDDFYGDGVNMAARLEVIAEPGGIACSAVVRNQVGNKLGLEFIDQGEKTVKNIAQPVKQHPESSMPLQLGAAALAALGEADRAREWVARALEIDPEDNHARYNAACTYSLLGESDRAIDLLEIWVRQVGPRMNLWFKNDSDLDSIRNHPRYQKILESVEHDQ